jgi:hypothetical protein
MFLFAFQSTNRVVRVHKSHNRMPYLIQLIHCVPTQYGFSFAPTMLVRTVTVLYLRNFHCISVFGIGGGNKI